MAALYEVAYYGEIAMLKKLLHNREEKSPIGKKNVKLNKCLHLCLIDRGVNQLCSYL